MPPEAEPVAFDAERRRAWAERDTPTIPPLPLSRTGRLRRRVGSVVSMNSAALREMRGDMSSPRGRLLGAFESLFVDHGVIRAVYWNFHEVAPDVYRAAQPSARHLERAVDRGIRTVVNLRGVRDCATYLEETAACRALGLDLIDFPMRSRVPPAPDRIRALRELFATVRYPILMHCKSGADRTGIASALYLLDHLGRPPEEAMRELRLRYGHLRGSRAGVLDAFLRAYAAAQARSGIGFAEWVDTEYDPAAVAAAFQPSSLSELIVDRILNRE